MYLYIDHVSNSKGVQLHMSCARFKAYAKQQLSAQQRTLPGGISIQCQTELVLHLQTLASMNQIQKHTHTQEF